MKTQKEELNIGKGMTYSLVGNKKITSQSVETPKHSLENTVSTSVVMKDLRKTFLALGVVIFLAIVVFFTQ